MLTFCSQARSSCFRKSGSWANARPRAALEKTCALFSACTRSATRFCPWLYGAAAEAGEAARALRSPAHIPLTHSLLTGAWMRHLKDPLPVLSVVRAWLPCALEASWWDVPCYQLQPCFHEALQQCLSAFMWSNTNVCCCQCALWPKALQQGQRVHHTCHGGQHSPV